MTPSPEACVTPLPGTLHVASSADVTVVVLEGEHDLCTRDALDRALGSVRPGLPVVVDLRAASFVDASIVGAIIDAAERHHGLAVEAEPGSLAARAVEILAPRLLRA